MKQAFLFPGQGAQTVGMGLDIFNAHPVAMETLHDADKALGYALSDLILQGPAEKLTETQNAQPAILTVSVAIGRVLREKRIEPIVMAGHSLGEYSALVHSEALAFEDAVRLVHMRGKFMQEAVPLGTGTMSAILGGEDKVVEEVCKEVSAKGMVVEPANYNCPGQLVISGTNDGVAAAVEILKEKKVKRCIPLQVSAPFHCSLLKPAADKLKPELEKVKWNDPKIPYVANVDCAVVKKSSEIVQRLADQVWNPVRWTQSLQKIFSEFSVRTSIEVGPGKIVSGHVKKVNAQIMRKDTDSAEAVEALFSA